MGVAPVMPVHLTLVHSPLVGPATWETLGPAVRDRGHQVSVSDLTVTLSKGPPYVRRQIDVVATSVGQGPTILVGHSGAGPLLAAAADACTGRVEGYLFIDAGLPIPGLSWFDTAPAERVAQLRDMARDGWLPPWSRWWGPEALEALLPDPELRGHFDAGCPSLPLAMFAEATPASPGWADRPGAYLRLSDAYQQPADQARALGWPVIELAGHHLSVLSDPALLLDPLLDLVAQLRR